MSYSTILAVCERLASADAVLIHVERTQGSVPRGPGTWMAVFADDTLGTIGGGQLEFRAIDQARLLLVGASEASTSLRYPLGPSLGQCCGGVVFLRFERVGAAERASLLARAAALLTPVALFGGGHVGKALVDVLSRLPFAINWIDSRDEIFPDDLPAQVVCEHSEPVQGAVPGLPTQTHVLIMSFSHAEDLEVVAACLRRQREHADLAFIGLIGSKTKWATFRNRLKARGFSEQELDQVTCPIGLTSIPGKEPEVIAVSVAAQLLQHARA